ncbi:hypothetical protein AMJ71_03590 [candidate division TA06 bacterium SM1_40]|uniref:LytR/CpsA/Psr regulator C-terminal domain-containing protein n=1 Tax=candidate division TA06 bacterium SM1_40 TaxID=1703773 RepID=A0A0S8JL55_UNCT6|nr:MAG: hypothetical protein AMJ71_03590 [candidate division TA06 bacterium SM1_40]
MGKKSRKQGTGRLIVSTFVTAMVMTLLAILLMSFAFRQLPRVGTRLPDPKSMRVEVLNGSGQDGMARRVAGILRGRGFDVVAIGNAERPDFEKTVVVERLSPDLLHARRLARTIGCPRVVQDIDSLRYIDVTLIVGRDFREFFDEEPHR